MGFVQHDHAVGNVVQLAAARSAIGEQRFDELYRGRNDNRCIPVFRRIFLWMLLERRSRPRFSLVFGYVYGGVMFNNNAPLLRIKDAPILRGVLFDDRKVRDNDDDPSQLVLRLSGMG